MSSCCGSVCLLVLLGVVLAFGSPLPHSPSVVMDHYVVQESLKFCSLISSSPQRKEQVQLMNATLDIYTHIFSSILQHSHHQHHDRTHVPALLDQLKEPKKSQVVSALTELRDKMEKLKKHLGRLDHQNLDQENVLSDLKKIMVDDPVDQRKALAQFREVYQAAAVVASRGCGSTR
uniref:Uncharacterized protein n=1 Tax=Monopterus albus TaxID=43700 RepID=A0A3Q3IBJ2_MONAL